MSNEPQTKETERLTDAPETNEAFTISLEEANGYLAAAQQEAAREKFIEDLPTANLADAVTIIEGSLETQGIDVDHIQIHGHVGGRRVTIKM